ncbi:MAG: redoxin domain-containing protein, partial [Campylobacterales bacterium]
EVLTIAVNSGSTKDIKDYMKERNLTFRFINDKDAYLAKKFNISAYPTTFIYDKDKKLVFSEVGYTSTLGLYIRMLLADKI